jgi:hypothetical protein
MPEIFELRVHKNATKPSARANSFETPESERAGRRIASRVPRPLTVIGTIFTMPKSALQAMMRPKLTCIFKEIASK